MIFLNWICVNVILYFSAVTSIFQMGLTLHWEVEIQNLAEALFSTPSSGRWYFWLNWISANVIWYFSPSIPIFQMGLCIGRLKFSSCRGKLFNIRILSIQSSTFPCFCKQFRLYFSDGLNIFWIQNSLQEYLWIGVTIYIVELTLHKGVQIKQRSDSC